MRFPPNTGSRKLRRREQWERSAFNQVSNTLLYAYFIPFRRIEFLRKDFHSYAGYTIYNISFVREIGIFVEYILKK